tara:strand:- start:35208 stop:35810 length:603 start_codon:yes stop_codon:yes gene_type:complete
MIPTNFSTRPFYNERAVYLALGSLTMVAILLLTACVGRFSSLFQEEKTLREEVAGAQREIDNLRVEIQTLGTEMSGELREQQMKEIGEVNELLKRRAFSWTVFLNSIEDKLPSEVMLNAVRPEMSNGNIEVELGVVAENVGVLDRYIEALEQSGGFENMVSREEQAVGDGLRRAVLYGWYRPVSNETVQSNDRTAQGNLQ